MVQGHHPRGRRGGGPGGIAADEPAVKYAADLVGDIWFLGGNPDVRWVYEGTEDPGVIWFLELAFERLHKNHRENS